MFKFISRQEKEKTVYDFVLDFFEKQEEITRARGIPTIPAKITTLQFMSDLKKRKLINQKYNEIMKKKSA